MWKSLLASVILMIIEKLAPALIEAIIRWLEGADDAKIVSVAREVVKVHRAKQTPESGVA